MDQMRDAGVGTGYKRANKYIIYIKKAHITSKQIFYGNEIR